MDNNTNSDPIDYDDEKKKWFFWDEVWAYPIGYWDTEEAARKALIAYGYYLVNGSLPDLPHDHHDVDD